MKKVLAIICAICLCFSLVSCGSVDEEIDITQLIESTEEITTEVEETSAIDQDETLIEEESSQVTSTTEQSEAVQEETTTTVSTTQNVTTTTSSNNADTTTAQSSTTTTTKTTTTKTTTTTAAATTTTKATTTTTTQEQNYCYVTIDMTNALNNISDFTTVKASFVPSSGILLSKTKVYYTTGETLFDAIVRACSENVCSDNCKYCQSSGIQIEYQYTPAYNSYYIEGVHQIYEMDCGVMSGWMVYVNGDSIQSSSSTIEIQNGDNIVLAYTCSMGSDINF